MIKTFSIPESIGKQFREAGVACVYLFGSHAEGTAGEMSDVDIAVLMSDSKSVSSAVSTHDLYERLYELLEPVVSPMSKEVDIVFLQRATLELQAYVVKHGIVVFDANSERRADYEEHIQLLAADFLFLQRQIDQTVLQRI